MSGSPSEKEQQSPLRDDWTELNSECVICACAFNDHHAAATLRCGHIFGYDCVLRWLLEESCCPTCKTETDKSQVVRLYHLPTRVVTVETSDTSFSSSWRLKARKRKSKITALNREIEEKDRTIKKERRLSAQLIKERNAAKEQLRLYSSVIGKIEHMHDHLGSVISELDTVRGCK